MGDQEPAVPSENGARSEAVVRVRTALLVDFENMYLGLGRLDAAAAARFASDLPSWTGWLERLSYPALGAGRVRRDLLVRLCYLNPASSGRFRADFTRSGFRVVDCPPLTAAGKNSADIHIVIDVLDLLDHPTRFDEIILLSSDADYTPVMQRLRAHDRRTVIVTSGPSAPAFRSTCDHVVDVDTFIELALNTGRADPVETDAAVASVGPARDTAALRHEVGRVACEVVASSERPVPFATIAQRVRATLGEEATRDWGGAGTFKKVLAEVPLPGLRTSPVGPSYVFDPARHAAPIPTQDLDREPAVRAAGSAAGDVQDPGERLIARICRLTDVPHLSGPAYRAVFEELAAEVGVNGFAYTPTSRAVRDRCVERGHSVSRAAVNFVLTGLAFIGRTPRPGDTPEEIARAFADQAVALCANARLELSDEELDLLRERITSPEA